MDMNRLMIDELNEYMKQGKCFKCRRTGHMSHKHVNNPFLNVIGNSSNFSKPTTPYKAIVLPLSKGNNTAQKVCTIMTGHKGEELQEAKVAFLESLHNDPEESAEEQDF